MAEPVAVFDGSRSKRMPRFDALAELMVRRLSDAEFHQQLAFMRELNRMREYSQPEQYQPSQETIEDVLAQLSAEADREA
jgi:phage shock protein A